MRLGEKIAMLRKEHNYTQEQLAELLCVSRQSVSKWESDIAYPETEKLIKMGKVFDCTMDYLLRDEIDKPDHLGDSRISTTSSILPWLNFIFKERISKRSVFGVPLYHVGRNAKGFIAVGMKARGVIAIGFQSCGVLSIGLLSLGVLSFGALSLGLLSLGAFSLGIIALGAISLGVLSFGAISIGIISGGALAVGYFSGGALAIGRYMAVGDHAKAMIALGDTVADGTLYSGLGRTAKGNWNMCIKLLDETVPRYLNWAKVIFQFLFCR